MTEKRLAELAADMIASELNRVTPENTPSADLIGMRYYEEPLFGIADAGDPMFLTLRETGVADPGVMLPCDVLPGAKSVISFFLPFTEDVRRDNSRSLDVPSDAWRQARIEGQDMLVALGDAIVRALEDEVFAAVQPSKSEKFRMLAPFCSNWSERHAAHIAGLGTFGLSKGLITARGMAGRIGSVVTDAPMPVTKRAYSSPFEYCTMCGACARRCPAGAIDPKKGVALGKDHIMCKAFLDTTGGRFPCGSGFRERYGCGKCQTGVPCEHAIPAKRM